MDQASPCCVYDFTIPAEVGQTEDTDIEPEGELEVIDPEDVIDALRTHCKRYCFQLEMGAEGYVHYQGRLSLQMKVRMAGLIHLFKDTPGFKGVHFSLTSNENRDNNFYVTKDKSCIDGPWMDTDFSCPVTRQMEDYRDLVPREWTLDCTALLEGWDLRTIHLVFDPKGNSGKSLFTEDMHQRGKAYMCPVLDNVGDLMNMALATKSPAYIIDMPRGLAGRELRSMYTGIESLKNGVAYDKRYRWRLEVFDRPAVIIFTNTVPDLGLLSRDKWKFWTINHDTWGLDTFEPKVTKKRKLAPPEDEARAAFKAWLRFSQ